MCAVGVLAAAGCATTGIPVEPTSSASSMHGVQVHEIFQSGGDSPAITYDEGLVPAGVRGAVQARSGGGTTTVKLAVRGLQPLRWYGAQVHTEPCGPAPEDAGPRFQYAADPVQPSVDPTYANTQNEIWLDLSIDEAGAGTAEETVAWEFPAGRRPGSVVLHAAPTSMEPGTAGTAGMRAACITVDF
jgi:superoxide dismutase, Cu-Zn family